MQHSFAPCSEQVRAWGGTGAGAGVGSAGWGPWPTAKLGHQFYVMPLFYASELGFGFSQAIHTFNLFERNSNCIFTAVSCIFYL